MYLGRSLFLVFHNVRITVFYHSDLLVISMVFFYNFYKLILCIFVKKARKSKKFISFLMRLHCMKYKPDYHQRKKNYSIMTRKEIVSGKNDFSPKFTMPCIMLSF